MTAALLVLGIAAGALAAWAGSLLHIARTVARALDRDGPRP
ncbi:hypothetical protein [Streptomyces sp. RFCAC02]|nr:hypothetical protein [Streptomyces sp. RFCAC02]